MHWEDHRRNVTKIVTRQGGFVEELPGGFVEDLPIEKMTSPSRLEKLAVIIPSWPRPIDGTWSWDTLSHPELGTMEDAWKALSWTMLGILGRKSWTEHWLLEKTAMKSWIGIDFPPVKNFLRDIKHAKAGLGHEEEADWLEARMCREAELFCRKYAMARGLTPVYGESSKNYDSFEVHLAWDGREKTAAPGMTATTTGFDHMFTFDEETALKPIYSDIEQADGPRSPPIEGYSDSPNGAWLSLAVQLYGMHKSKSEAEVFLKLQMLGFDIPSDEAVMKAPCWRRCRNFGWSLDKWMPVVVNFPKKKQYYQEHESGQCIYRQADSQDGRVRQDRAVYEGDCV